MKSNKNESIVSHSPVEVANTFLIVHLLCSKSYTEALIVNPKWNDDAIKHVDSEQL